MSVDAALRKLQDSAVERGPVKMEANLVLDTVYSSDDFRLYCHKVLPCAKRAPHDWASCPFGHPGEKAKRRNIRTHYYSADMCAAVIKGEDCKVGSSCSYSHNVFESFLHPSKYRTMMCKDRDRCARSVCFFAHSPDELRQPTDIRPLPEQQQQQLHHLQAVAGTPGHLQGSSSSSEAAMVAALAAADGQLRSPAAAASMQPGAWHLQMQVASLADQLVRATSNTSVMSSTVNAGSGPPSPSAGAGTPAAAAIDAAGGNVHHLLNHLIQDANSARQQLHVAQQQLQAMASSTAGMPMQGGFAAYLGAPNSASCMPLVRQLSVNRQASRSEGMPISSVGSCYVGHASGYAAMDCTEGMSNVSMELTTCTSASLSELSATLPLLTPEQMAQLRGANGTGAGAADCMLIRNGSISSRAPAMQWGQQLAAAAKCTPVVAGVPSRLGMHQLAANSSVGARGPAAHMIQQQQQQQVSMSGAQWQQQQQQLLSSPAGMMMQVPGGYAMGHAHVQQQQVMPGPYCYAQGLHPAASQANTPFYVMQ